MGYQILAISPDTPERAAGVEKKYDLNYTLLSDSKLEAARAFGLVWRLNDQLYQKYLGAGIDIEQASGEKHHLLPVPAAYVVDREGRIAFSFHNPDHRIRVKPQKLLEAAKKEAAKKE